MRSFTAPLVCLVLLACQKEPNAPTGPAVNVSEHGAMVTWFADRGITIPPEPPVEPAGKPVSRSRRILGDASRSGTVDSWDLLILWYHLRGSTWYATYYDMDLVDIDRDGDNDWDDLKYFGEYLYVSSTPNPYGIGEYLDPPPVEYDIELVFVEGHGFSASQMDLFEEAAQRWESIIIEDVWDFDFGRYPYDTRERDWWDEEAIGYWGHIVIEDEVVDDLRVFVASADTDEGWAGRGGPFWIRGENKLSILGRIVIAESALTTSNEQSGHLLRTMIHELGHVLGFGTLWGDKNLIGSPSRDNPGVDTYFKGWRAYYAFNRAGGTYYRGRKVPVENGGELEEKGGRDSHWRESVFGAEVMSSRANGGENPLSEVTIWSLADIGYMVDASQADPYKLPPVAAKPVLAAGKPFCQVLPLPPGAIHEEW